MNHRIFPNYCWPASAMTIVLAIGGLLLSCAFLHGCDASQEVMSHSECIIKLQELCHQPNTKLTESTFRFEKSESGNNTVMCGHLLETLKCVARQVSPCFDWFYDASSYYFLSQFDCEITGEQTVEIQMLKNNNLNTDANTDSVTTDGGKLTSPNSHDVTTASINAKGENATPNTDSGSSVNGDGAANGGYTVANTHGDKAQHSGKDSSSCLTLSLSLMTSAIIGSRLISKLFTL